MGALVLPITFRGSLGLVLPHTYHVVATRTSVLRVSDRRVTTHVRITRTSRFPHL